MSSLVITIANTKSVADLTALYAQDAANHRRAAINLKQYFDGFASGNQQGTVDVQISASNPVASTGTVTLTYASVAAADTVTIAGQVLTCTAGAPSTAQFQKVTDGPTTAANLKTAINAHATLSKYFLATSSGSAVTVTGLTKGSIGNLFTITTSNGTGFAVVTFAGGTGGVEAAAVSFARG